MTATLETFRCQSCNRVVCSCHLPAGAIVRVRCRDCKTVNVWSVRHDHARIVESMRHIDGPDMSAGIYAQFLTKPRPLG